MIIYTHAQTHTHVQGSLYSLLIEKVDNFRDLIGAPDTEKFNIVLLGGMSVGMPGRTDRLGTDWGQTGLTCDWTDLLVGSHMTGMSV